MKRRSNEEVSISFLDVICCGFGAIVLLLLIVQTQLPQILEPSDIADEGRVRALQEELFVLRGEIQYLERELNAKHEQLDIETERVAILRGELNSMDQRLEALRLVQADTNEERRDLNVALQTLTDEMRRLLRNYQVRNDYIGGIPVDSEYVIFVIDTSGSMSCCAWGRLIREVINILDIYPQVKGMQVMNDMGQYMFNTFRGEWIPDTPARRQVIISQLRTWHPFSNSSPVEGVTAAIREFYSPDHKISIYIMGDDYTGRSLETVLRTVRQLNRENPYSEPMVRIHAIGFPVLMTGNAQAQASAAHFAALMRELTGQNLGTFVGLNDFR